MRLSQQLLKNFGITSGLSGLFGGGEPKDKKPPTDKGLSYKQINQWSEYADKNPTMDFNKMWAGFSTQNPNSGIDPNLLQQELGKLRQNSIRLSNKSDAVTGDYTNTGLSFPRVRVDGRDYGRVNSNLQTEVQPALTRSIPSSKIFKTLPSGVEDVWFDEKEQLVGFINPQTGDIEYADRENLNHPMLKKKTPPIPMSNPAEIVMNK